MVAKFDATPYQPPPLKRNTPFKLPPENQNIASPP